MSQGPHNDYTGILKCLRDAKMTLGPKTITRIWNCLRITILKEVIQSNYIEAH